MKSIWGVCKGPQVCYVPHTTLTSLGGGGTEDAVEMLLYYNKRLGCKKRPLPFGILLITLKPRKTNGNLRETKENQGNLKRSSPFQLSFVSFECPRSFFWLLLERRGSVFFRLDSVSLGVQLGFFIDILCCWFLLVFSCFSMFCSGFSAER